MASDTRETPPLAYAVPGEKSSPLWAAAFAAGCGGQVEKSATLRPGAVAMFGSPARWTLLRQAQAEGRDWWYGDHGYFKRGRYFSVTLNGWKHDGLPRSAEELARGKERLRGLGIEIAPPREDGDHVLVCPPSAGIAGLFGFDAVRWQIATCVKLARVTKRPLVVREKTAQSPLAADLERAWAMVTWASNAAVEALCAGVPVFCTGHAAARRLALDDPDLIETPRRPPRATVEEWAATLAANQWTLDEMRRGDLWRALGPTGREGVG